MCTQSRGGPSGYLLKAPLKILVTAPITCAFKQIIWKSLFRLQVAELPDEKLSFLSLFILHTQILSYWGPSWQDHNLSSRAGKSLSKYWSKDTSWSFTIKERVRSGIPVSLTQASITPWISAVIVEPVTTRKTQVVLWNWSKKSQSGKTLSEEEGNLFSQWNAMVHYVTCSISGSFPMTPLEDWFS